MDLKNGVILCLFLQLTYWHNAFFLANSKHPVTNILQLINWYREVRCNRQNNQYSIVLVLKTHNSILLSESIKLLSASHEEVSLIIICIFLEFQLRNFFFYGHLKGILYHREWGLLYSK